MALSLGLTLIVLVSACSKKTLSVFFDGVPVDSDTTLVASVDTAGPGTIELLAVNEDKIAKTRQYYHPPYRDKECGSCHDQNTMGDYVAPQPDLCYQCHEDFASLFTNLHVPVEMGSCTDCHNPHLSREKHILKMPEMSLCFTCHDCEDETWKEIHDGLGDTRCTECHNPHGSNDNGLLK